jgi:hypothetical protein
MVWEIVFMLVLLKIPFVYLCMVVWWAIRAEPNDAPAVGAVPVSDTPDTGGSPVRLRGAPPRNGRSGGGRRGARLARRVPSRPHASRSEVRS